MAMTKNITQTDLDELVDILHSLGIEVRSPHERMVAEEQDVPAEANANANANTTEVTTPAAHVPDPAPCSEVPTAEVSPSQTIEASARQADAAPATQDTATATQNTSANGGNRLTRAIVVQALLALGVNPAEVDPPRAPAVLGGNVTGTGGSAASSGGGGTAVATSTGVHAAAQPVIKGKGAVAAPACSASSRGEGGVVSGGINSTGFLCGSCNEWNLRPTATHYYVVTVGREVGIFDDWHVVAPLVTGVSGAVFKRYSSLEVAEAVFNEALAEGRVRRV